MPNKSKIFISWSGDLSRAVADGLVQLLNFSSDEFAPWMSDRDIESGVRGLDKIATELRETTVGICVVTDENQSAKWLNFEAGALSKQVGEDQTRVMPLLVDLSISELEPGPLTQFQGRELDKEGVKSIISSLARLTDASEQSVLDRFESAWSKFEDVYKDAISKHRHPSQNRPRRTDSDMLEEILALVRQQSRELSQMSQADSLRTTAHARSMSSMRQEVDAVLNATLGRMGRDDNAEFSLGHESVSLSKPSLKRREREHVAQEMGQFFPEIEIIFMHEDD
ncbi:MAG: toll/interleukin-1 receptor domain-containing protein [Ornithinimicrobium sp.]